MKKGVVHTIVICLILAVSIGFGFLYDAVRTNMEYRKYPQSYAEQVTEAADAYGIPVPLLFALIRTESDFSASFSSEDGAIGLLQILPETYERICTVMPGEHTENPSVLYDPVTNLKYGCGWLEYLYMRYGGWDSALAAFRIGTDTVDNWVGDDSLTDENGHLTKIPDQETASFVKQINETRNIYERLYP